MRSMLSCMLTIREKFRSGEENCGHLKRAREEGKRAFFDKKEPDKLIIDGHMDT